MTAIAASGGEVDFIPQASGTSYFYESFDCQQAVTNGYGGIQFTVQGPAASSFAFELQSAESCSNTTTLKRSYQFVGNLTGQRQTITFPFAGFEGDVNYDAIVGMAWSTFSQNSVQWSIGNIALVCGSVDGTPVTSMALPSRETDWRTRRLTLSSHLHEVGNPHDDQGHLAPARHHLSAGVLLEPPDRRLGVAVSPDFPRLQRDGTVLERRRDHVLHRRQ
jgi:hypothetical protein